MPEIRISIRPNYSGGYDALTTFVFSDINRRGIGECWGSTIWLAFSAATRALAEIDWEDWYPKLEEKCRRQFGTR